MTEKICHKLLTTKLLATSDVQILSDRYKPLTPEIELIATKFPLLKVIILVVYCNPHDDNLNMQEHMARSVVVSGVEMSVENMIKEFFIWLGYRDI